MKSNFEKSQNMKFQDFLIIILINGRKILKNLISPIKFCFLDVDLYLPTKFVLENISKYMISGGILLVDDVKDNDTWDGSYEAFMEYVKENNLNYKLVGNKSGLIKF